MATAGRGRRRSAETWDMTATDFKAWVEHMKATRRWSGNECARQLGCGENQIRVWKSKGAPAYIGLACTALSQGWPEWKAPPK